MGPFRGWRGWMLRALALLVLAWALAEPVVRHATVASADHLVATPTPPGPRLGGAGTALIVAGQATPAAVGTAAADGAFFPETGFAVAPGPFANYFRARGGARTFGPPLSNRFPLLGHDVQLFRRHALRLNPDGSVATMSLLDTGAVPGLRLGGRTVPAYDQQLAAGVPPPGAPDYATRSQEFIRANAPDEWQGLPVGFHRAFLATVTFEDAFPTGTGDRSLLPGFAQEVWGLPVSRPTADPQNPDLVHLRWERGVMEWDRRTGQVQAIPLGELAKAVLTGEGVPPELAAAAQGSRFYRQFDRLAPNGVARPAELPETNLLAAFQPAGQAGPSGATAGPTSGVPATPTLTPSPSVTSTPTATIAATFTPTATVAATFATPRAATDTPGVAAATTVDESDAIPNGTPGADPCYGDEQITYAPEEPRVGTELLIAVSSARPHSYGRLAGTERATFVRQRPGQLGVVYEWTVTLSQPGTHEYTFFVDSTLPCKKVNIRVRQALGVSTSDSNDNLDTNDNFDTTDTLNTNGNDNDDNSNGNDNGNSNGNDNDNSVALAEPTPTPTPTATATGPRA